MMATTVILASGFFVFLLAYMLNLRSFGLLIGCATLVAFLADVLLAPALSWTQAGQMRTVLESADCRRRQPGEFPK